MDNKDKIILDLCGGTGAWSQPYKNAGYDVRTITLPEWDVTDHSFEGYFGQKNLIFSERSGDQSILSIPVKDIFGVLAAPPCTMFSLARTKAKKPRDLKEGMELVRACLDIIWTIRENNYGVSYPSNREIMDKINEIGDIEDIFFVKCEKNCPDYNGMSIRHIEQCECPCHPVLAIGNL